LVVGRNSAGSKPRHVHELVHRVPFDVWACFTSNEKRSKLSRPRVFMRQRSRRRCTSRSSRRLVSAAAPRATERGQTIPPHPRRGPGAERGATCRKVDRLQPLGECEQRFEVRRNARVWRPVVTFAGSGARCFSIARIPEPS
jgi:hypothetical protein